MVKNNELFKEFLKNNTKCGVIIEDLVFHNDTILILDFHKYSNMGWLTDELFSYMGLFGFNKIYRCSELDPDIVTINFVCSGSTSILQFQ